MLYWLLSYLLNKKTKLGVCMKDLTKRQEEILDYIKRNILTNKNAPTFREIGNNFNISVKAAYDHVKALEKKNILECRPNRARSISLSNAVNEDVLIEIPLIETVLPNTSINAEENVVDYLRIPQNFIGKGLFFAIRVPDDAMVGIGVMESDIAVIRQQHIVRNGEIIATAINERPTLRRYYVETNRIKLSAENEKYNVLYTRDASILGKLAYIIRSY